MSRTANVVRLTLPPERRVLVISDIHGNLPFFRGVNHTDRMMGITEEE